MTETSTTGTETPTDAGTEAQAADTATPENRIAELEAEIARLKDQALRALAESENVRRRAERDKEDAGKYAVASLARDLVSVADNLRRALDAAPAAEERTDAVSSLLTGVEATERELLAAFERRGIARIEPMGEKFDPNRHEAVFEVPGTGQPAGTVVQVLQAGYSIHDRLLRPAMVGVAKGGEETKVDTTA
jgi:molecular chaperone GrpE